MLSPQFFAKLQRDHRQYVKQRREIINITSEILACAKQAIFALHRDEIKQAESSLTEAEKLLKSLQKYFIHDASLANGGAYKAALEEYVEAKLFWQTLKFGKISPIAKIELSFEDYLAGICDLTGELLRKIVLLATAGNYKQAKELKELISDIMTELAKCDLTGYLRGKYDAAERNLKRAEEILYEITIRTK